MKNDIDIIMLKTNEDNKELVFVVTYAITKPIRINIMVLIIEELVIKLIHNQYIIVFRNIAALLEYLFRSNLRIIPLNNTSSQKKNVKIVKNMRM